MGSPVILGIETATPHGGVALADGEGRLLARRWSIAASGYSRALMPMIEGLLAEGGARRPDLGAIGVSHGPGAFTGLRVGLVTAKTLAYALGVPLYPESTLEMLALAWPGPGDVVCPLLDARRGEIYTALYRIEPDLEAQPLRAERAESLERLLEALEALDVGPIRFSGDGAALHEEALAARLGSRARFTPPPWNLPLPEIVALRAARALRAGRPGAPPFQAVPVYLRASDAERAAPVWP